MTFLTMCSYSCVLSVKLAQRLKGHQHSVPPVAAESAFPVQSESEMEEKVGGFPSGESVRQNGQLVA